MKRLLTEANKNRLYFELKKYLLEVLEDEEYLTTLKACKEDAIRVEVYGNRLFSPGLAKQWLQGLPIGVTYCTYNICKLILNCLRIPADLVDKGLEKYYLESDTDLDDFYWETLGKIIYNA